MRFSAKAENEEFPSVPPGFESSSLTTKGVKDEVKEDIKQDGSLMSCSLPSVASELPPVQIKMEVENTNAKSITRSLRCRSWVKYNQHDCSSDDDSDCEKVLRIFLLLCFCTSHPTPSSLEFSAIFVGDFNGFQAL